MSTDGWIDGYPRYPIDGRPGLPIRQPLSWRVVLHTTEGSTATSALATYRANRIAPHFTVDYSNDVKMQHVPITAGAYALKNASGGVETNAGRVIQIELVGFAGEAHFWSNPRLDWYAQILDDITTAARRLGHIDDMFDFRWPPFYNQNSGFTLARVDAPQRASDTTWLSDTYNLYGHQHVPENDHWDPGLPNINYLTKRWRKLQPVDDLTARLRRRIRAVVEQNGRLKTQTINLKTRIVQLEAADDSHEQTADRLYTAENLIAKIRALIGR